MTIKELFEKGEDGTLTFEQFEKLMSESGAKFVDLSEGNYVSKDKFENEVTGKDGQITQLNDTIKARDKDLKELKSKLENADIDNDTKLKELQEELTNLQTQYKTDTENYKKQLSTQAYEFAVKEYAGTKKFSSKAARRDFERELIAAGLKMDSGKILGADDYATKYFEENSDALVVEKEPTPEPTPQPTPAPNTPTFVAPTTPDAQKKHKSLSELMKAKNENPNAVIDFE